MGSICGEGKVLSDRRISAIAAILAEMQPPPRPRALVVGCGSGREAAVLAADLEASIVGVDLVTNFSPEAMAWADLRYGDATALDFPDASFDVLFSYHVLEHIPATDQALAEMHRVLRPGGVFCIGTPNRQRLVGYVGGSGTPSEIFRWNLADWRARLAGRFRNELGAHAGFAADELGGMLRRHFRECREVTGDYYRRVYASRANSVAALCRSGLGRYAFPGVYFAGSR